MPHEIQNWFTLAVACYMFQWIRISIRNAMERWRAEKFVNDIESYIETGIRNETVDSLDYRAFKTAVAQRRARVKELELESQKGGFHAVIGCPACMDVNVHWINEIAPGVVQRQCRKCEYKWNQIQPNYERQT